MQSVEVNNVLLEVGQTVAQNFSLRVASSNEVVEVTGAAPVVTSETVTLGEVLDQRTVQEIPLNGRHFLDMGFLVLVRRLRRRMPTWPHRCVVRVSLGSTLPAAAKTPSTSWSMEST